MLFTSKNKLFKNQLNGLISALCVLFLVVGCKTKSTDEAAGKHDALPEQQNIVEVMVLELGGFTREMVSNGKLAAVQKAQLWFKNSGIIETITARNGETVAKGTVLARLHKT